MELTPAACEVCGSQTNDHNRHIRLRLPDLMAGDERSLDTYGLWMSESDPDRAVMIQHPHYGAFVRALLPVRLAKQHTVTYGVWVRIRDDDLDRVSDVWWEPEYADLKVDGRLANAIQPWDLLDRPVALGVVNPNETPVCLASPDADLNRVLTQEWDHQLLGELGSGA